MTNTKLGNSDRAGFAEINPFFANIKSSDCDTVMGTNRCIS